MRLHARAAGWAAGLTMAMITVLTIAAEFSAPLKGALAAFAGHHWVAKGIVSLVFFLALAALLSRMKPGREDRTAFLVAGLALLLAVVLFLFFVYEFFA
ncbi:MAG: hypothetical protein HY520_01495 [Candidatus Aenigmarchaeota archaeon]|nr:hypothetical protein [Candidatus Aenigmarchaeota archaeon]